MRKNFARLLPVLAALAVLALPAAALADQTAAPCPPGPAASGAIRLLVTATGAHPVTGNVTFTLYGQDRARFLAHHGAISLTRTMLAADQARGCFVLRVPGTYAIAIYHDANNNHRFDRTLLGLPAEGYGFSNNPPTLLGLPAFNTVTFRAGQGDTSLTIKLHY